jgi:hypothetical protein
LGEPKRCRVCGLPGARNRAGLPPDHTRAQHEALRPGARQPTVRIAAFGAPRSTTPRRWQRA